MLYCQSIKTINKLVLNWAKLSSHMNWTLLLFALNWWLGSAINQYISLNMISLYKKLSILSSTTPCQPCHTSLPKFTHWPFMVNFKLDLYFPGVDWGGWVVLVIIRIKAWLAYWSWAWQYKPNLKKGQKAPNEGIFFMGKNVLLLKVSTIWLDMSH